MVLWSHLLVSTLLPLTVLAHAHRGMCGDVPLKHHYHGANTGFKTNTNYIRQLHSGGTQQCFWRVRWSALGGKLWCSSAFSEVPINVSKCGGFLRSLSLGQLSLEQTCQAHSWICFPLALWFWESYTLALGLEFLTAIQGETIISVCHKPRKWSKWT